jgi:P4 family phage/plasmid primase-like protien
MKAKTIDQKEFSNSQEESSSSGFSNYGNDFINDEKNIVDKMTTAYKYTSNSKSLDEQAKYLQELNNSLLDISRKLAGISSPVASNFASTEITGNPNNQINNSNSYFNRPTDDELADHWIYTSPKTVYGLGNFRRLKNGVWVPVQRDVIEQEIMQIAILHKKDKIRPTDKLVLSCQKISRLKTLIPNEKWDTEKFIIPCKNGFLDLKNFELFPEKNENCFFTSGLNCDYNPDARCPQFLQFLESTIPYAIPYIQEFMGICLTKESKFEAATFLVGPSGSGKSTLIHALVNMMGTCAGNLGLDEMEHSRFTSSNIPGKYLLYSTESTPVVIKHSSIANRVASGESIIIDKKFKTPYEYTPFAKLLFAMNTMPRFFSDNGLSRRARIISFPELPVSKRDVNLKRKVSLEASGILNFALDGLKRVIENDAISPVNNPDFSQTTSISAAGTVDAFVARKCALSHEYQTQSSILYNEYMKFCNENGFIPENNRDIVKEWHRLELRKKKSNGCVFWEGIRIKS